MKILYNGELRNETWINYDSRGFQYGDGFFTTIKVVKGIGENLDSHRNRIRKSFTFFNYNDDIPSLEKTIERLVKANSAENFKLKVIFFRDLDRVSNIFIPGVLPEDVDSVNLTISQYYRGNDPIYKYKSLNYYSNLRDSFRIILDSEKRVLETGIGNIFIIEGNRIVTPPDSLPLLPGTFRDYLLNKKEIGNFEITQEIVSLDSLLKADGVFFTNALRGVVGVKSVDKTQFSLDKVISFKELIPGTN